MPLYQQAKEHLRKTISQGLHPVDSVLPPVEQLAVRMGCGVGTIRRAIGELAQEGIVRPVRNRGSVVLRRPAVARVVVLLAADGHTNLLLQNPLAEVLSAAHYQLELVPALNDGEATFQWLDESLAASTMPTYLVVLGAEWWGAHAAETLQLHAARFQQTIWFSIETPTPGSARGLWVTLDHLAAARQVVDHLLTLGHRRIGVFADYHPGKVSAYAEVLRYCRDLLAMAGAECIPSYRNLEVPRLVREERITAYWDLNDYTATNNLLALGRAGFSVPGDVSLIGRNDTPWSRQCEPTLTSVSWPPEAVAAAIANLVKSSIDGSSPSPVTTVEPRLIARASSAAPAKP